MDTERWLQKCTVRMGRTREGFLEVVTELSRKHRNWSRDERKAQGQNLRLGRYLGGTANRTLSSAHGVPPEAEDMTVVQLSLR